MRTIFFCAFLYIAQISCLIVSVSIGDIRTKKQFIFWLNPLALLFYVITKFKEME